MLSFDPPVISAIIGETTSRRGGVFSNIIPLHEEGFCTKAQQTNMRAKANSVFHNGSCNFEPGLSSRTTTD